jgi:NAD(P)-dependent dehydrogenase (short-subunit alcohol dehydrogenase family)
MSRNATAGRLDDKVAVIAGLDEVSAAIARRFETEGARVAVLRFPWDGAWAQPAAPGSSISTEPATIEGPEDARRAVRRVAERGGPVDILVNNTLAPVRGAPFESKTESALESALRSVKAAFYLMQAVFPGMQERNWGRIINMGSRYGELMNQQNGEYNTAAWALRGMTRTAAAEWAKHRIAVNVLEHAADTADFRAFQSRNPGIVNALLAQVPMRRRGDLESDIGAAAVMLACDECNQMTGQVLYADGGQHLAASAFNLAIDTGN